MDLTAQIMTLKRGISWEVETLNIIYPPFYRRCFHNGSIAVFSSVTTSGRFVTVKCDVSDVQCNPSDKVTDGLPCLREVVMGSMGDFFVG